VSAGWLDCLGTPKEWAAIRADLDDLCDLRRELRREWWVEGGYDGAGFEAVRRDTREVVRAATVADLRAKVAAVSPPMAPIRAVSGVAARSRLRLPRRSAVAAHLPGNGVSAGQAQIWRQVAPELPR
jgi:hypothetical protein